MADLRWMVGDFEPDASDATADSDGVRPSKRQRHAPLVISDSSDGEPDDDGHDGHDDDDDRALTAARRALHSDDEQPAPRRGGTRLAAPAGLTVSKQFARALWPVRAAAVCGDLCVAGTAPLLPLPGLTVLSASAGVGSSAAGAAAAAAAALDAGFCPPLPCGAADLQRLRAAANAQPALPTATRHAAAASAGAVAACLAASAVAFRNADFGAAVQQLIGAARAGLGVDEGVPLDARLMGLWVCGAGERIAPHAFPAYSIAHHVAATVMVLLPCRFDADDTGTGVAATGAAAAAAADADANADAGAGAAAVADSAYFRLEFDGATTRSARVDRVDLSHGSEFGCKVVAFHTPSRVTVAPVRAGHALWLQYALCDAAVLSAALAHTEAVPRVRVPDHTALECAAALHDAFVRAVADAEAEAAATAALTAAERAARRSRPERVRPTTVPTVLFYALDASAEREQWMSARDRAVLRAMRVFNAQLRALAPGTDDQLRRVCGLPPELRAVVKAYAPGPRDSACLWVDAGVLERKTERDDRFDREDESPSRHLDESMENAPDDALDMSVPLPLLPDPAIGAFTAARGTSAIASAALDAAAHVPSSWIDVDVAREGLRFESRRPKGNGMNDNEHATRKCKALRRLKEKAGQQPHTFPPAVVARLRREIEAEATDSDSDFDARDEHCWWFWGDIHDVTDEHIVRSDSYDDHPSFVAYTYHRPVLVLRVCSERPALTVAAHAALRATTLVPHRSTLPLPLPPVQSPPPPLAMQPAAVVAAAAPASAAAPAAAAAAAAVESLGDAVVGSKRKR